MNYLRDFRQVIYLKQILASALSPSQGCNNADKENADAKMYEKF